LGEPDDLAWIEDGTSTLSSRGEFFDTARRSGSFQQPPPSRSRSFQAPLSPSSREIFPTQITRATDLSVIRQPPVSSFGFRSMGVGSVGPSLGQTFQLVRETRIAIRRLKDAEEELAKIQRSNRKNASVVAAINLAARNRNDLKTVEQSYRQRLEALERRLELSAKHAKSYHDRELSTYARIHDHFKNGKFPIEKVLKAKREVDRLQHELEDAELELQELRDATAAMKKSGEDDPFDVGDPFGSKSSSNDDPFDHEDSFGKSSSR